MKRPHPIDRPQPRPDGPQALTDFDFAIGEWTYVTTVTDSIHDAPDWERPVIPAGKWHFRYALDGWVVEDNYEQPLGDGATVKMLSIRAFDPKAGFWRVRGVSPHFPGWDDFEASRQGDELIMVGISARTAAAAPTEEIIERITFYDFEPNSWKRRGEQSSDDGKTWTGNVVHSLATRCGLN